VLAKAAISAICLGCSLLSYAQASPDRVVVLPDLSVRYTPPEGMTDKSSVTAQQARERANAYRAKAAELLLDMSSESDTAPEWHQIWLFHFPRAQMANVSDWLAEAKLNSALAGPRAQPVGQPKSAVLDGHSFLVSEFEQTEPPFTKHAKIYTTLCRSQLLSFVFVANSAEQIARMEDSLKSLNFSGK
jgi:hypothetical protein